MKYFPWLLGIVLGLNCLIGCSKTESGNKAQPTSTTATSPGNSPPEIIVDEKGFTPSSVTIKQGSKTTLTFKRTSDDTCAKEVVFPEINLKKDLPLNQSVKVEVPTDKARKLTFQCGMGMFKSAVIIQLFILSWGSWWCDVDCQSIAGHQMARTRTPSSKTNNALPTSTIRFGEQKRAA
jgi:hypothetical protein